MSIQTYVEVPRAEVPDHLGAEVVRDMAVRELGLQRVYIRYFRVAQGADERFRALLATACLDPWAGEFAEEVPLWGKANYADHRTIWVNREATGWQMALVVAHEVRHAWQYVMWPLPSSPEDRAHMEADAQEWSEGFVERLREQLEADERREVTWA